MSVTFIFKKEISYTLSKSIELLPIVMDYQPNPVFFYQEKLFVLDLGPSYKKGSIGEVLRQILSEQERILPECMVITQKEYAKGEDYRLILDDLEPSFHYSIHLL
jgi:hypothetical protein